MARTEAAWLSDVALLVARLLLGVVMFAHGYRKLVVDGIGRTAAGFESMSIPVAIASASFVTVVELVGGTLLILGLMTRTVAVCMGSVMAGAAAFVVLAVPGPRRRRPRSDHSDRAAFTTGDGGTDGPP